MVGMGLWMRELASWRPVVVGKVAFPPAQLIFSRDGRFLLAQSAPDFGVRGTIFDFQDGSLNSDPYAVHAFDKNHGLETFPRIWFDNDKKRFLFSPAPGKIVALAMGIRNESELMSFEEGLVKTGWSQKQREVYGEAGGNLYIWDWNTGKLKRRVRYSQKSISQAVFSPDGSLLLALELKAKASSILRLYNAATGRLIATPIETQLNLVRDFGFSPDGQFIWNTRVAGGSPNFEATRLIGREIVFSTDSTGPVKWLPDGRIGIVKENGFEWRDSKGNLLTRLPGPFQSQTLKGLLTYVKDWVLSPDGKWIYSCEQSGTIRRWRAR